jgi:tripeptidyl-peptidase-1
MKMRALSLVLSCLLVISLVSCGLLTSRDAAPEGWLKLHKAHDEAKVHFTLALKQRNMDILEQKFWEVSDPFHANYQKYMTIEEINAIVAPPAAEHDAVVNYLVAHGIHSGGIKSFVDALEVETTVGVASRVFSTTFHYFRHVEGSNKIVVKAFGDVTIADEVHCYIAMITGITGFPIPHLKVHRGKQAVPKPNSRHLLQTDNEGIVAQGLTVLYDLPAETLSSDLAASQGVIEFDAQNFAPSDLAMYSQQLNLPLQVLKPAHIVGGNDPGNPQDEASLDIQMIASVNREADNWFWMVPNNGWLYEWTTNFFSTRVVPMVNSVSYAWWEEDQCSISANCGTLGVNSDQYTLLTNGYFQKLALRGISILTASGDSGANGRTDEGCTIAQLRAAYPSSSPYVTSVGATQLNNPSYLKNQNSIPICQASQNCASGGTEVAVSYPAAGFASGGGFSNLMAQPSYQAAAVNAYWSSGVEFPPATYFNKSGRGAPDIAALGYDALVVIGNVTSGVSGTSMATPISAGIMSLLNQESMKLSNKPLGFLNPFLYAAWADDQTNFNDVTVGNNKCTEQGCGFLGSCKGFTCAKGWDPVTGLGSPNFSKLAAYLQKVHRMRKEKFGQ